MKDFFTKFNRFAALGISRDPKSFSRKAVAFLQNQGCEIFPVNPNMSDIDGQACYKSVESLPEVDAAIFFTPPRVTERLLPACKEKGIIAVWFQQGSADDAAIKVADGLGINYHDSCVYMHHPNAGFPHNFHGFVVRVLGKEQ